MSDNLKYQILKIFDGHITSTCGLYQDINDAIFQCEELNKYSIHKDRYIIQVVYW